MRAFKITFFSKPQENESYLNEVYTASFTSERDMDFFLAQVPLFFPNMIHQYFWTVEEVQ